MPKKSKLPAEETIFQKYFIEKGKIGNCILWKTEFPLYRAMDLLKRDFYERDGGVLALVPRGRMCGRIDVLFRYRSKLYAGEIKYSQRLPVDFWDATKIIAYTAWYNYQAELLGLLDKASPAVLVPKHGLNLEHKIVANKIKLKIFSIHKTKDDYNLVCENE